MNKLIARSGHASRRHADILIAAGRVTVNGVRADVGARVEVDTAVVEIDGIRLPVDPGLVYYLLAKPKDVISSSGDPHGRPTVTDLVPDTPRVYPVGRLDADSEGLIVLTNDGDLTLRLTHPRYRVTKTYVALVDGEVTDRDVRRLIAGIELEDGLARAQHSRVIDRSRNQTMVEVVMMEGRKREVRRLFERLGHPVRRLVRTAIGPLKDQTLRPGRWRPLAIDEVRRLYGAAQLPWQDEAAGEEGPE